MNISTKSINKCMPNKFKWMNDATLLHRQFQNMSNMFNWNINFEETIDPQIDLK